MLFLVFFSQNKHNIIIWMTKFSFSIIDAKDVFALLKGHERKVAPGEEPTFTWFKSGQEFDPEDRFKVLFKVCLFFPFFVILM